MGVVIIINFPYSTCISSFFSSSGILLCSFLNVFSVLFLLFFYNFSVLFLLFFYNILQTLLKEHSRSFKKIEIPRI